ncbi:hypothetical protein FEM48_Zijuj08G0183000 [Ziziphus jujuba var. spinosa]|uniref:WAT1-related protein n=1 Tax=Ziziphus jujuba var. spinosa TaxID=714518 RepID=A0A978V0M1_ZIZJJ|nr:hypothetical protein FEM48_Zijuj08G0183000 [Ziziphus jujuba var. spinosa]
MDSKKPYLAVIFIQMIYSGMILLSKAAFNEGMNSCIFIFYRQLAGTVFVLPFAMIFERKNATPLSFVTFCKIFMVAFLGITLSLNAFSLALIYTNATLGAAAVNCLPVTTFFYAVLLRMEKVRIRTTQGLFKIAGLLLCIIGVAILTFYKGPKLKPLFHHYLLEYHEPIHHQSQVSSNKRWIIGCLLFFVSINSWGLWLVFQTRVLSSYPSKLSFTALQCLSSAIQSFIPAIALERDPNQWKLGWDIRLILVLYCGIMVTGVTLYLQTWVLEKKGPVFQAMSQPLNLIFTIFGSIFLLGEVINLGSVLGGIFLVVSLYTVLWGENMNKTKGKQECLPVQAEKECVELKEQVK